MRYHWPPGWNKKEQQGDQDQSQRDDRERVRRWRGAARCWRDIVWCWHTACLLLRIRVYIDLRKEPAGYMAGTGYTYAQVVILDFGRGRKRQLS